MLVVDPHTTSCPQSSMILDSSWSPISIIFTLPMSGFCSDCCVPEAYSETTVTWYGSQTKDTLSKNNSASILSRSNINYVNVNSNRAHTINEVVGFTPERRSQVSVPKPIIAHNRVVASVVPI